MLLVPLARKLYEAYAKQLSTSIIKLLDPVLAPTPAMPHQGQLRLLIALPLSVDKSCKPSSVAEHACCVSLHGS